MKRIINIYNFIRAIEPRIEAFTPAVLYETTASQIELIAEYELTATFALQYDALIDAQYQNLLREKLPDGNEIAAWWEIVQPLAEKAGITWRGRYAWDWRAHVGFSPGYTPVEREKLVDVYMEDFREAFGYYPHTVGSWFIDAHTLAYMADRYGIIASCNCKDQVGTDGYTLWGGYWNQAYYPSRKNAYLPAQDAQSQIDVPIFRMLGSDPIYQYDDGLGTNCQKVLSLEPVYGNTGANPDWVRWFFDFTVNEPCLAFAYAQAGQENSFTWARMRKGFEFQMCYIAELVAANKITVETLAETGRWFRSRFPVTPATAVTVLKDWKQEGCKTVWYNSRFYRINFLWRNGDFRVRDIHLFDQEYTSPYLDTPLTTSSCRYDALPIVDGFHWSQGEELAGIRLVEQTPEGERALSVGDPTVLEEGEADIVISCPVERFGELQIHCTEDHMEFRMTRAGDSVDWALSLQWATVVDPPVTHVDTDVLSYTHNRFKYHMRCSQGHFAECDAAGKHRILIAPDSQAIILDLSNGKDIAAEL